MPRDVLSSDDVDTIRQKMIDEVEAAVNTMLFGKLVSVKKPRRYESREGAIEMTRSADGTWEKKNG